VKVSSLCPGGLQVKGVFSVQDDASYRILSSFAVQNIPVTEIVVSILTTFYLPNVVVFLKQQDLSSKHFSFNHQPWICGCGLPYTSLLVCWRQRTNVRLKYFCFENILQVAFVALGKRR